MANNRSGPQFVPRGVNCPSFEYALAADVREWLDLLRNRWEIISQ